MKFFQSIQEYFAIMGINSSQSVDVHPFNRSNLITLLIFCMLVITSNKFLLFEAKYFEEYIDSFYLTCTGTLAAINFVVIIWKMTKVFEFIKGLESVVHRSKCYI